MTWNDFKSWLIAQLLCLALQISITDISLWLILFAVHGIVAGFWTVAYVGLKRGW